MKYFAVDWLGVEVTRVMLGIVGMGSIGCKVAQRARAFNMRILYHNRNQRRKEEEEAIGAHYCAKMEELLQQSDFVMLVVNLTPETHKLIEKKELGLMKPTAALINISQGAVIDQDALLEALQNKVIRAAALDVTYPEPLPRNHPGLNLNNIIITPHIGTVCSFESESAEKSASTQNRSEDTAVTEVSSGQDAAKISAMKHLKINLIMEGGELPGLLVNEIGGIRGILHSHVAFLKKNFHLITMKEFLENRKDVSKKIQAIYLWWHKPVIDQELLQSLPNLKVIANSGVGMDHLDLKLVASFGVKMANAPRAVSSSTADTGMALLLASARRLVEVRNIAISPSMEYCEADILGVKVAGATLGIIGMGSIGYKIALRAKAFEMNILYHNRTRRKVQEEQAVSATYCKKIDSLLQQADFVMVAVSLTPQTHKLIGKRELELMKPGATLINISRGAVVDQEALVAALQTGVIRAAALDVTYPEPLLRDHPLLKLKNVIITPHVGIKTDKATYMITEEAVENILAALNGLPIPNEVLPS